MRDSLTTARPRWQGGYLHLVQILLVLVGEVGWLTAWSQEVGAWFGPPENSPVLGWIAIVGLLVMSIVCTRIVLTGVRSLKLGQLGLALLGAGLALAVGARAAWLIDQATTWSSFWMVWSSTSAGLRSIVAALLALVAWWRGIVTARERISSDVALSDFRAAFFLLASAMVMNLLVAPTVRVPENGFTGPLLMVLFAGLAGLPFAQIVEQSERRSGPGGAFLPVNRHWLAMLLLGIGTLLVVANLLALVLTFERIDAWYAPFAGPVDTLFWTLFYLVLLPVGYLVAGLIYLARLILHPSAKPPSFQPTNVGWIDQLHRMTQDGNAGPVWLLVGAKWLTIGILGLLVVGLLARAIFRYADGQIADDVEELRDFIWSWRWLGLVLKRWLARLRDPMVLPFARSLAVGSEETVSRDRSAWGPRELYQELLRLGARLGRKRTLPETPTEYERALVTMVPEADGQQVVHELTRLYVQARYSPDAVSAAQVTSARLALARLEAETQRVADAGPYADDWTNRRAT